MGFGDTIELTPVTLGLIAETFAAVDVIMTICKALRMVHAKVVKVGDIEHIIAPPEVGIDDAVRDNFAFNDWDQCGS